MTDYIAEFRAPKQRITRPFGYVIKAQPNGTYSVNRKYYDSLGGYDGGHYDMTYEEAATLFAGKVSYHVKSYPPEVFDKEIQS